jgi:hypothetical protein
MLDTYIYRFETVECGHARENARAKRFRRSEFSEFEAIIKFNEISNDYHFCAA